jgi:hypothetical protein
MGKDDDHPSYRVMFVYVRAGGHLSQAKTRFITLRLHLIRIIFLTNVYKICEPETKFSQISASICINLHQFVLPGKRMTGVAHRDRTHPLGIQSITRQSTGAQMCRACKLFGNSGSTWPQAS